jgi:peptide/nickel transport system substrate-binding protein
MTGRNTWGNLGGRRAGRRALLRGALTTSAGAAAFLVACGGGGTQSSGETGASGTATARGEPIGAPAAGPVERGGELVIRRSSNLAFWDQQRASGGFDPPITRLYAASLLNTNQKSGELEPGLAESWEQTNETTITLRLRKDVQFGDGTPLNAEAVKYTFERGQSKELNAPVRPTHSLITKIETPDTSTVVLGLDGPNAAFLETLSGRAGDLVSPTAHQKLGDIGFNKAPVGAGPYTVERIVQDGESTLVRNPTWPFKAPNGDPLPYFDRVRIKVIPENAVSLAALRSGEIDLDYTVAANDIAQIRGQRGLDVATQDGASFVALEFATNMPPVNAVALRRAINYAIDRVESNQSLASGMGAPATGPLTALSWAFDPSVPTFSYDPAKAKEALAQAGLPDGVDLKCATYSREQAELLQAQLARQKIRLTVDNLELAVYQDKFRAKGEYQVGTAGGPTPTGDPYEFFLTRYGSKGKYNPGEPSYPEWDDLIARSVRVFDREERKKIYSRMQHLDHEMAYRAWIITSPRAMGFNAKLKGLSWYGYNPDLRLAWKAK